MHKQAVNLILLMGEASAMDMFLQDRMIFQMLRPYERTHMQSGEIRTHTALSLRATVLVFGGTAIRFKLNNYKTRMASH